MNEAKKISTQVKSEEFKLLKCAPKVGTLVPRIDLNCNQNIRVKQYGTSMQPQITTKKNWFKIVNNTSKC